MYEYDIPDMSCGHCVSAIETAIKAADPEADAQVDLMKRRARVSSAADPQAIAAALDEAGYPSTYRTV
ncbi:heavy-metal-associated domain-containing protein [Rhizobium sp.]